MVLVPFHVNAVRAERLQLRVCLERDLRYHLRRAKHRFEQEIEKHFSSFAGALLVAEEVAGLSAQLEQLVLRSCARPLLCGAAVERDVVRQTLRQLVELWPPVSVDSQMMKTNCRFEAGDSVRLR